MVKTLKHALIEQINARAECECGSLYQIAILMLALRDLNVSSNKGLLKGNPKIRFCWGYIDLMLMIPSVKEEKKFLKNLMEI